MTRARARRLVLLLPAGVLLTFAACDGPEREETARYYIPPPPDAEDEDGAIVAEADGGVTDAADAGHETEAGDADAEVDAGPSGARAIATGAGVGHGDHSCAIAGPDRGVYCWGANDHAQLGLGTTGAGTTAADVLQATRIPLDETGLPLAGVDELAPAGWHTCARAGDVTFCWGQRLTGAQAEPPMTPNPERTRPRAIGNLDSRRLAAGGPHTCVLKTNGRVACFGHSTFNELGRANPDDVACTAPFFYDYHGNPTHTCSGTLVEAAVNVPNAVAVAAGEVHSCLLAGGRVHCWGTNLGAQLGRPGPQAGELNPQLVVTDPTLLTPLDQVVAIASAGAKHTCALRAGAVSVWCWGTNDRGQLGADPALLPQRVHAAAVPGLTGITSLGASDGLSCAVKNDGSAWCWGRNEAGQLGDGTTTDSFAPVQVKGPGGAGTLDKVTAIAPGVRHVCALRSDATVWCWGKNDRGQLGDGTTTDSAFPVKVAGLPP